MAYGNLTVICGPMYAGKTTELLRNILWSRNGQGKEVLVIKPAFDNRYSCTDIVTHDGLSTDAHAVTSSLDWFDLIDTAEIVFLDEVQFFMAPYYQGDIVEAVSELLSAGKTVYVNGLDLDAKGKPFAVTATMLAMADDIVKLKSSCSVCGQNATKTFKTVADDKTVELGSTGLYEPRCNRHWTVLK